MDTSSEYVRTSPASAMLLWLPSSGASAVASTRVSTPLEASRHASKAAAAASSRSSIRPFVELPAPDSSSARSTVGASNTAASLGSGRTTEEGREHGDAGNGTSAFFMADGPSTLTAAAAAAGPSGSAGSEGVGGGGGIAADGRGPPRTGMAFFGDPGSTDVWGNNSIGSNDRCGVVASGKHSREGSSFRGEDEVLGFALSRSSSSSRTIRHRGGCMGTAALTMGLTRPGSVLLLPSAAERGGAASGSAGCGTRGTSRSNEFSMMDRFEQISRLSSEYSVWAA